MQTFIVLEGYSTARSEKYFQDAFEFKPERWLRENKDESHPFSSVPFGFGPRMCLGKCMWFKSNSQTYLMIILMKGPMFCEGGSNLMS